MTRLDRPVVHAVIAAISVLLGACTAEVGASAAVVELEESSCPAGYHDMLDWMTLDADLRADTHLVSTVHPLYTVVDAGRFWWLKTPQGDTWDVVAYDDEYLYFHGTEDAYLSPWVCKSAIDLQAWRAARRCVLTSDPASSTITNEHSTFEVVSSGEALHTSGDQGTFFRVQDLGAMSWGELGDAIPTLVLDYHWNCWAGECHRLERYFLTQRFGLVRWAYYEHPAGVDPLTFDPASEAPVAQSTFDATAAGPAPAVLYWCDIEARYDQASISAGGAATSGSSAAPSIDDTGRFIAYGSVADNLVPGDTNSVEDIFVYDGFWNVTLGRASVATGGAQADGHSRAPVISRAGEARYIAFESDASNLVAGDTNGVTDVFVHDRWYGTTSLVSVGLGGVPGNAVSSAPSISANGCRIAFQSDASNLVEGDTNGPGIFGGDIFVRDQCEGVTRRVSVSSTGAEVNHRSFEPSIDDDGRFVAFISGSDQVVPGDTNGIQDVFVYDDYYGLTIERESMTSTGSQADGPSNYPRISGDARYVAFLSSATNLVPGDTNGQPDVFVHDRWVDDALGATTSPSLASSVTHGGYNAPAISTDGRFVVFTSVAGGVYVPFMHDRSSGATIAPLTLDGGRPTNAWPAAGAISTHSRVAGGTSVPDRITFVFVSTSTNVVPGSDNGGSDIFTRTMSAPPE